MGLIILIQWDNCIVKHGTCKVYLIHSLDRVLEFALRKVKTDDRLSAIEGHPRYVDSEPAFNILVKSIDETCKGNL
jgi:hypothetical protein